jgi:uncharacterized secreted protein with C-terminal beta-propeller domain
MRKLLTAFIAVALIGAGAATAKAPPLSKFTGCAELVAYSKRHGLRTVGPWGFGFPQLEAVAAPVGPGAEASGGRGDVDFSPTNVQEADVDEPDIVKTDGARILAVAEGRLRYVDVSGPAPRLLGSLALEPGFDHQLLVHGDRALVLSTGLGVEPLPLRESLAPIGLTGTVLTEVDVSSPDALRIVRTLTVDGTYLSARLVSSTARVVLRSTPDLPFVEPGGEVVTALKRNRAAIARSRARNWLPQYTLRAEAGTRKGSLVRCRDVRYPRRFSGLGMLTVLTIDLAGGIEPVDSDAVVTDGEIVYASKQSLYVATQRWLEPGILATAPEPPTVTTALHRFDIADPAATEYRSSGQVPGFLLNQWSLSEHEGKLRVASTSAPLWWTREVESESFVTVLEEREGKLAHVGQVGGLGRGERIFGVRFVGDAGFVVTFRVVDPLYALDLSDPTRPTLAGELKLLGYSAYLHPVGENLLLGIGQDATEQGQALGTQVSLFDVSDLRRPVRLDRLTVEGGYSEAEYDHHAFLYWPATRLAVLPVQPIGALGIRVEPAALDQVGEISSRDEPIRRALVVGDTLYTLSGAGLRASSLETLEARAWVPFR